MTAAERHVLMDRLAANVDQLAYPYTHREVFERTHNGKPRRYGHITHHAPLIIQLEHAIEASGSAEGGGPRAYESSPSARLDAVDRHRAIANACRAWLAETGTPARASLVASVRALIGAAARLDSDSLDALVADTRAWWCWARVVTGWDTPAWTPHGPCPVCETLGSLRVRLAVHTAACIECGAWWDSDSILTLGRFIEMWSASRVTPVAA